MGIPLTPGANARGARNNPAERKLVTVMLCDVDESVEDFAERDPEDVDLMLARHLDRIRDEVESFGGEIEHVVGGRALATFGVPRTRDDDPERAVRAALAIRDALTGRGQGAGVRLHIAIATGEALVRHDAARRGGQRVLGDLVTTCAHLQEATPTGAIMVTDATMQATERTISYGPASIVALRNGEPVTVWSALEPRAKMPPGTRPRRLPPLVARMRELGALLERFAFARAGGTPQLVVVTGPPGIGKSRLLTEFSRVAEAGIDPAVFRHGRSLAYNDGMRALSEIVETEAGILETDSADEAERKLEWAVFNAIDDPAAAVWVNRHLRRLLGTSAEGQLGAGDREEMLVAWRHYLYGRAQQKPLVLAMEDLHWADDTLLDFIESVVDPEIAAQAGQVPLIMVAAARPELLDRRPSWLSGRPGITVVPVEPLAEADTSRLVTALLSHHGLDGGPGEGSAGGDTAPDPALLARIAGNPLFAEEYVRMLRDRGGTATLDDPGQLPVEGAPGTVTDAPVRPAPAPPPMPTTVHAIIAARLDALPADEKALIHDAAVIGHVGWVGALARVGGGEPDADREAVETLLTRLERKDFLLRAERSRVAGETEYRFHHLLVRDVAYGQIVRAERAAKHQRAAAWIEAIVTDRAAEHAELLAHHYHSAYTLNRAAGIEAPGLAAKAMRASRDAGDRVAALGIYAGANRYYSEALALCPAADPGRADLLLRLGRARCAGEGGGDDVLREAHALLLELADRTAAAEAQMLLAEVAFLHGSGEERAGHVNQALALIEDAPPSPGKAAVLKGCMLHLVIANRHAEALEVARQVRGMARGLGLRDLEGSALGTIGLARVDAGDPGGIVDLENAITIFEQLGTPGAIIWHMNLAYARATLGDLPGCFAALAAGSEMAERFGSLRWIRAMRLQRVAEYYWTGEWDEAVTIVNALVAESGAGNGQARHYLEWECRLWRGRIRLARGQVAAALDDAEAALLVATEVADPQALNPTRTFRARALLAAGRDDEAHALATDLLTGLGGSLLGPELGVDLGVVLASLDLLDGSPAEAESPLAGLGVPPSRWRDAIDAFVRGDAARAADLYATIGSAPDEAHARLEAARDALATGHTPEGEDQLSSALAFYRQVAASAYLVEAEALESTLVREP